MSYSICIHENEMAILYRDRNPISTCMGTSFDLEMFIAGVIAKRGKIPIFGKRRIGIMRDREKAEFRKKIFNLSAAEVSRKTDHRIDAPYDKKPDTEISKTGRSRS